MARLGPEPGTSDGCNPDARSQISRNGLGPRDLTTFMNRPSIPPEDRHVPEPEIIPPEPRGRHSRSSAKWTRLVIDEDGVHRISVTRIGPLGFFAFWLIAGIVALALIVFFLGAFVFLLPLVAVLLAVGVGMSIWRFVSKQLF